MGKQEQTDQQKEEMKLIFDGFKSVGNLDYVTAWYKKACEFIEGTDIEVSFVSTNSICQGEQVAILWQQLKQRYDIKINFAHQTFKWSNEAKNNAGVYVVIVGFSFKERKDKVIFTYDKPNSPKPKHFNVEKINSYLVEGKDVFFKNSRNPICNVPKMVFGSMPNDGGNLLLTEDEKNELLIQEPNSKKFIRTLISSREYLNNGKRYCLWLEDITPSELNNLPIIKNKVQKVKEHRLSSKREDTRKLAEFPTQFGENRQPKNDYILVPLTTSENREYIPIGFMDEENIVNNTVSIIESDDLVLFGILTSKMHMTWMRYVCGRLESRYRYSSSLVYNNFPFPKEISDNKRKDIILKSQEILNIRNEFPDESLANLYNPLLMPSELKKAHFELDNSVDKLYRSKKFSDDNDRMKFLFDLYLEYTSK